MLTVAEAARHLDLHPNTIRQWSRDYSEFLSPAAAPPKGQERRFADDDMAVLWTIHVLKQEGKQTNDILAELATGTRIEPADGQEPTEAPQEPTEGGKAASGAERATEAATMALELVRGQVESLTNERDYLRSELAIEREARIEAERRAASAEAKLEQIEQQLVVSVVHSDQTQEGPEGEKKPWYRRLFGG